METETQTFTKRNIPEKLNLRVLMVEDDYISIFMTQKIFEPLFDIVYAKTASEATTFLSKNVYDLILMDINLGDENITGVDLLKQLRKEEKHANTKVFAVTGYAMDGDREKYLNYGFNEHFPKPLSQQTLVEAIQKVFPEL
jgi:CheY-like chemotaxis protein